MLSVFTCNPNSLRPSSRPSVLRSMNSPFAHTFYVCCRKLSRACMLPSIYMLPLPSSFVGAPSRLRLLQTSPTKRSWRPCWFRSKVVLYQVFKLPHVSVFLPRNLLTIHPFYKKFSLMIFLALTKSPMVHNLHNSMFELLFNRRWSPYWSTPYRILQIFMKGFR